MPVKKIGSVVGSTIGDIPGTIGGLIEGALYASGGGLITEVSEFVAEDIIGVEPILGKAAIAIGAKKVLPGKLGNAAEIIAMKDIAEELFRGREEGMFSKFLGGAGAAAETSAGNFK